MAEGRRLTAIMFTDIVGFTHLTQSDESAALRMLRDQETIFGPIVEAHKGRQVKSMGDGILLVFPNALDAVECGVVLQQAIRRRNSESGDPPLRVRIGIHLGDVEVRAGDVLGDAVNIASRLEPLARPGEVCVSEPVYVQVRNKVNYFFEDAGPQPLEGVREPMGVYRIPAAASTAPTTDRGDTSRRIAVLPFANLSPNPDDGYLADGITEELIGKLSGIAGARVIARTSVMHYKGSGTKVADVGRELGVGRVVEGSVRRSGNRLRLTAQLIDARSEEHLWALQYDRDLHDIFEIQTEIAGKVAEAIESRMTPGSGREPPNVTAYTTYLRALQLLHADDVRSIREAIQMFGKVHQEDPGFALAYSGEALGWVNLALQGVEEWSVISTRAEPAARRALELAPELDEPHAVMADLHGLADRHQEAISEAETAIRLNPNASTAHRSLAIEFGAMGRVQESYATLKKAHELDPLSPRTASALAQIAQSLGHAAEARALLVRMHQLYPSLPRVSFELAMHDVLEGDPIRAAETIDPALVAAPTDALLLGAQAMVWAVQGKRELVESRLSESRWAGSLQVRRSVELGCRLVLGDLDLAFEALNGLADEHSWPWLVSTAPAFAPLRRDPRFSAFCQRVGLPVPPAPP